MTIRNLTPKRTARTAFAMLLCSLIFIMAGCATTSQKINLSVLEECRGKEFKLGVVKATAVGQNKYFGFGPSFIDQKKSALERIPIDDICLTLSEQFGLKIDTGVDRTPRVVMEQTGDKGYNPSVWPASKPGLRFTIALKPTTENAYYGNLEYDNASLVRLMFAGNAKTINDRAIPDVVNVMYWMEERTSPSTTRFLYAIHIKSIDKDVLELKGVVGSMKKAWSGPEQDLIWDVYIENAGQINEALKRDLAEASKE